MDWGGDGESGGLGYRGGGWVKNFVQGLDKEGVRACFCVMAEYPLGTVGGCAKQGQPFTLISFVDVEK